MSAAAPAEAPPRRGGSYLRNLLAQTGARILLIGSTLVTFIAIARLLGPGPFGQYSYAVTFATLLATLADFGTSSILGKELSERRGRDDRAFFGAFVLLRAASALVLVPPALLVARFLKPDLGLPLAAAALAIPFLAFRFFEPVYQVYERPWDAIPPALASALVYFGSTVAVLTSGGGVVPLLGGYAAGNATYVVTAWWLSRRALRPELRFDPALVRGILRLAAPLGVATVFTSLNSRIGTLLLGELRSDADVGLYNAAFRFLDFAAMGGVLLVTPLIPIFAKRALVDRPGLARDYASLVEHLAVVAIPAALVLPFVTGPVIALCFGPEFAASAPILDILGLSGALVFFSLASSAANVSLGVVRHGYWVGGLAVAVNLCVALPLVPRLGPVGAAWGALAAEISMLAVSQWKTSGALPGALRAGRFARLAALGALLAAWIHAIPLPPAVAIGSGLAAYGVAVACLGLVEPGALLRRRA